MKVHSFIVKYLTQCLEIHFAIGDGLFTNDVTDVNLKFRYAKIIAVCPTGGTRGLEEINTVFAGNFSWICYTPHDRRSWA